MKKVVYSMIAILVGASLIFGVAIFSDSIKDKPTDLAKAEVSADDDDQSNKIGGVEEELNLEREIGEGETISIIHKMTHQKIVASDKWGAIEMTKERIDELYELVDKSDFEHRGELKTILDRWKAGDFSRVDEDHNTVWRIQGGSIGRAQGIMSKEQEDIFIENNFR